MFVALVFACAFVIWKAPDLIPVAAPETTPQPVAAPRDAIQARPRRVFASPAQAAEKKPVEVANPITPLRRLRWVALAAVPSSLMLGMTTYLTTDIAAIPFFWVIPLALYLMTFILVFARWPIVWTANAHDVVLYLQPCFVMFLIFGQVAAIHFTVPVWLLLHSGAFFATALMCHGELARDRPDPRRLTEFYLWLSVGGVLGGLCNALLAPLVFRSGAIEYPAAMVLAFLLRPRLFGKDTLFPGDTSQLETTRLGRILDIALPVAIAGITLVALLLSHSMLARKVAVAMPVMAVLALLCRPLRLGLGLAALLIVVDLHDNRDSDLIFQDRGFFGFVKVRRDVAEYRSDGQLVKTEVYHTLVHGGINHGMQNTDPKRRREPITYFHPTSGVGQMFEHMKWSDARIIGSWAALGPDPMSALANLKSEPPYAVVGLGIGTLAAHARPFQPVDFYEIDPLIRRLSEPPPGELPLFYYVQDAHDRQAELHIKMGDGRLMLDKVGPDGFYHIIVLDAFSSDAIPVHLLTAEAIDLYLRKLAPGGLLIFNATNRYVDIASVLTDIAAERGLVCYSCANPSDETPNKYASDWVVVQRREFSAHAGGSPPLASRVAPETGWRKPAPSGHPIWTDAYSNLLRVIIWRTGHE